MKKCRVLHVNDGNAKELTNGNRFFAENYPKMEEAINRVIQMGYEVKQMVPQYSPSIQGNEGSYMFYLSGYAFYLEKEFKPGENDDEEFNKLFDELNPVEDDEEEDIFDFDEDEDIFDYDEEEEKKIYSGLYDDDDDDDDSRGGDHFSSILDGETHSPDEESE